MMKRSAVLLQNRHQAEEALCGMIRETTEQFDRVVVNHREFDQHAEDENSCSGDRQEKMIQNKKPKVPTPQMLCGQALRELLRRVRGYVVREEKTTYEYDGAGEKRIKNEVVTRKRQGPDLSAIIFVLTNIDPQHWKAKGFTEQDQALNPAALPDFSALTDPELQELAGWGDIQNED